MSKALIENFTKTHGWSILKSLDDVDAFCAAAGEHVIFVPGNPERNLESGDVAVILPEIAGHFQNRFDVAIAGEGIEYEIRERFGVFKTPSLMFVRSGEFLGAIPRVRDWDDYIVRTTQILGKSAAA